MRAKPTASLLEAAAVAAQSLRASKLRTFLTLLGIILATATLIAVMAIIEGMDAFVARQISENLGANRIQIQRIMMIGNFDPKKWLEMQRRNPQLTPEEFEYLREKATLVKEIGMESFRGVAVEHGRERMENIQLQGSSPAIGVVGNLQPASGRFFTEIEDRRHLPVAFIGRDVKERLFPNVDAVGKEIDIQGRRFEVIGVGKTRGNVFGRSLDNYIVIPIGTFFKVYGSRVYLSYYALARGHEVLAQAQDELRMLMRAWRGLRPKDEDNFGMGTSDSLLNAYEQMTAAIAATAVAVVSVFMVVGGVVIMNIMLAVVTERTHEIGIRKAVGARRRDVLQQFLVESSMMAGSGGLIGVLIAWVIAVIVRNATPVPMELPASAVFVGVGLSAAVGLFFGIYPARRAAKLDPIVALRFEK
ncbi:MAG: ABC transporter permease [Acidobacteria bacterium]|nr:ABC transporter permease [Acidobacteriota bacterium]